MLYRVPSRVSSLSTALQGEGHVEGLGIKESGFSAFRV